MMKNIITLVPWQSHFHGKDATCNWPITSITYLWSLTSHLLISLQVLSGMSFPAHLSDWKGEVIAKQGEPQALQDHRRLLADNYKNCNGMTIVWMYLWVGPWHWVYHPPSNKHALLLHWNDTGWSACGFIKFRTLSAPPWRLKCCNVCKWNCLCRQVCSLTGDISECKIILSEYHNSLNAYWGIRYTQGKMQNFLAWMPGLLWQNIFE